MNTHALSLLEFPETLALVATRAATVAGAAAVRRLTPRADPEWIRAELTRVSCVRAWIESEAPWSPEPIPDLEAPLQRLRAAGSRWSGEELLRGGTLLRSSRVTRDALLAERRRVAESEPLEPFLTRLVVARAQESVIERAIDTDGSVKDEASPALRRIRRELRAARSDLVHLLERAMSRLDEHHRVPDMSVTVRNGRYVIPVRREGRGAVGGIIHDESASRGTLFVEPPAAVEAGNRIRELEADETREVDRILMELTDLLRPLQPELTDSWQALVELDTLYARSRYAVDCRCASVELSTPDSGFRIRGGRHPLLIPGERDVVPFDLEMPSSERTLLLSGPNTGGKTVLLKAIGLISALTQSGVPAPVEPGSTLCVFDDCFADIGDEQSIEASLSTFSAHLRNLREILARATPESLVLIDELGSGTDPAEGAALGGAILETLTRRGTFTVATTHLGALKLLATEVAGVVNASLQFDVQRLAPTYRLIKGIPGRSYGLGIARRLGLSEDVLSAAEARLPRGEQDLATLLADLERRDAALAEREAQLEHEQAQQAERESTVSARERDARLRERALERESRREARQYLLDARTEVDRVIRQLQQASGQEAAREARRAVEEMADRHAEALTALDEPSLTTEGSERAEAIEVGDSVHVESLTGRLGLVLELRDAAALVSVGSVKMTVPLTALVRASSRSARQEAAVAASELPEATASTEIDLRGLRVDEMERALTIAIDAAVRSDLHSLRIIHGKGTGALRERVAELLRGDARVRSYRLGAWNEGGAGVTMAELG
jgi:DNA mismatch repair protein MutS2